MPCSQKINGCAPCTNDSKPSGKRGKNVAWLAGLLLAVLPKCPFCVLAFSSTMILCGKGEAANITESHHSPITIAVSAFFCVLAITGILLSYKDHRTRYALIPALMGTGCILWSVSFGGGQLLYYSGTLLMITAIGFNMKRFRWMERLGTVLGWRQHEALELNSHIKNKQL